MKNNPKILLVDIETKPILANVWRVWEENVPANMIEKEWGVIAWAAKWKGEKRVFYKDLRKSKNYEDSKEFLTPLYNLILEADILVTFNGKRFDEKKLNARFVLNGLKAYAKPKHIDIFQVAKSRFGFTFANLDYLTHKLCKKHKKEKSKKFPGFALWKECLLGNQAAWKEMELYNIKDVLSLEELYEILYPWNNSINFSVYNGELKCHCGSEDFHKRGFAVTNSAKYQKYRCKNCGSEQRDRTNLLTKDNKVERVPVK